MFGSCTFAVKKATTYRRLTLLIFLFQHKKAGWTRYVPEEGKDIVIMDTLPSSGMGYHYMFSDDGEEKRRVLRRGPKITIGRI